MHRPSANTNLSQNSQYIQWFPGHMTRTKRQIQSDLKLVDAVAEIVDARLPLSSRNPDLPSLIGSKPRIVLMNKCDLADPKATKLWIDYFRNQGLKAIELDCKTGRGLNNFVTLIREVLSDQIAKWESKGMKNHSLRVMIVGIPNVGKSSFINRISKSTKAKVEDRPGVTRGNQWFTIDKNIELLDTPGVLWPRFDDQLVGERLAFTGAVKDQIMDTEQLSLRLLEYLQENINPTFLERFDLNEEEAVGVPANELLSKIALKRGMLVSGGEADCERAAVMILDEFRAAKLGRITLELP
ncbi:MAG: ribosome biogenesis GTPase YlqF [Clostridia bacterium]|nr:ribosome biogenesis GTPase YlqF [Clostridia bacterium]